jgi:hypothetical protein
MKWLATADALSRTRCWSARFDEAVKSGQRNGDGALAARLSRGCGVDLLSLGRNKGEPFACLARGHNEKVYYILKDSAAFMDSKIYCGGSVSTSFTALHRELSFTPGHVRHDECSEHGQHGSKKPCIVSPARLIRSSDNSTVPGSRACHAIPVAGRIFHSPTRIAIN